MKHINRYPWQRRMLTLAELAEISGIPETVLRRRLTIGWSIKRAMTQAVQVKAKWGK